ncbi:hypothetical protein [Chromobacterium phragmitis]|uniref:Phage tail protein n=1 Tax=Chromobacterium phragmitis TaxID=2202141 RepID=A0A344UIR4_9NEIS|nr:hypothetical protein [Chromobacterium phragmitis]AXE35162.1 hypothetical protein DK843_13210 [Chromobacterium phragmitis]
MKAEFNKIYAHVLHGHVHWIFTAEELPEWNDADLCAIDITAMSPRPEAGWLVSETGEFSRPTPYINGKDDLLRSLDDAADTARLAIAGDPLRVLEYQQAEAEAQAYKNTGALGEPPAMVKSLADAKEWSGPQAADHILQEATAWRQALAAIRELRIKSKEAIRQAPNVDEAQAIVTAAIERFQALASQTPD